MLNTDIHTITEKHLDALIQDKVSERDTLEYKAQLNLDRNELLFPEEMVRTRDADCHQILMRSFNMLWQACGHKGSPHYDAQGNWLALS